MPAKSFIVALVLLIATGCTNGENPGKREIITYYNLKGLLEQQLVLLDSLNPTVNKTAKIDDITESNTIHLDSTSWSRELDVFFQADINEPVLRDSYRILEETEGNQRIKTFVAKNKEEVGVEYLKIYFHQNIVQKVEALYKEKNALYNSSRQMTLNFQQTAGEMPLLASYKVKGKQKMILKDPVAFQIEAELAY